MPTRGDPGHPTSEAFRGGVTCATVLPDSHSGWRVGRTHWSKDVTAANISRRDLNRASLSLLAAVAVKAFGAATHGTTEAGAATRRKVIQQSLPGDPPREIVLIEVNYPPGAGSPAHLQHANGVMAFVVADTISSQLGEGPEQTFHAGEAWWGPTGTIHRVSRNASATAPATLLAIYVAPRGATPEDLMKPI
jgi:quercetin dioxygenase-like cupin family protein